MYKTKRKTRVSKRTLRLSASSVGERGTMPLNVPQRKKGKKALQVTWSDTKSCQYSEKESNASEECTNFIAFMASVIDEPLKKEALSELVSQVTLMVMR